MTSRADSDKADVFDQMTCREEFQQALRKLLKEDIRLVPVLYDVAFEYDVVAARHEYRGDEQARRTFSDIAQAIRSWARTQRPKRRR
jgi:hypothetical protein